MRISVALSAILLLVSCDNKNNPLGSDGNDPTDGGGTTTGIVTNWTPVDSVYDPMDTLLIRGTVTASHGIEWIHIRLGDGALEYYSYHLNLGGKNSENIDLQYIIPDTLSISRRCVLSFGVMDQTGSVTNELHFVRLKPGSKPPEAPIRLTMDSIAPFYARGDSVWIDVDVEADFGLSHFSMTVSDGVDEVLNMSFSNLNEKGFTFRHPYVVDEWINPDQLCTIRLAMEDHAGNKLQETRTFRVAP